MDDQRADDEFERMARHEQIARARELIAQYLDHMALWPKKIEEHQFELGRLRERLGG